MLASCKLQDSDSLPTTRVINGYLCHASLLIHLFIDVYRYTHAVVCTWRPEDSFKESPLSFYHVLAIELRFSGPVVGTFAY